MTRSKELYRSSIENRDEFWTERAKLVRWHKPFNHVLDYSNPPFARWFVGGELNLCDNAIDRHLADRGDQAALIYISSETNREKTFTYRELHAEVMRMAAVLQSLGVSKGDRVLIYMPMVPEALFAMFATVRLGAIHSVVFGGFGSHALATRIDDAEPKVIVSADAGLRGGKAVTYKGLLDEALRLAKKPPRHVVILDRGISKIDRVAGRDLDYATLRAQHLNAQVDCVWLESSDPSYILCTSGTTGKPKGVQRDTGGYAVALATSMRHIYGSRPGETYFTTSDIGWVVGHSYIVYGPLINGTATILYEGLPTRPDPGIWWKIVQDHRVSVMFTSPTAVRVLKKQDDSYLKKYDLSSLRHLFIAGEPLDEPTARWISEGIGKRVFDHYWQTETGWAILTAFPGIDDTPAKFGSPSFPSYGYDVRLLDERTGKEVGSHEKGVVCIVPPLPPGCMTTVWRRDEHFVETYFHSFRDQLVYTTFDWGVRDDDGYYFILGRTDDVMNVAGHRLGTREIEEAVCSHHAVAEVAVVGKADALKGQVPVVFATVRDPATIATPELKKQLETEIIAEVDLLLGAIARPAAIHFVAQLPKTRSGKLLRRSILAIAESRDPGDLSTLDDPSAIECIKTAVGAPAASAAAVV